MQNKRFTNDTKSIYRYDIWMAELPAVGGSHVQGGRRPVVIVSNQMANKHSPVITVVPLTSNLGKNRLPTHVILCAEGLTTASLALGEQIQTIDKTRLTRYMGRVSDPSDRSALNHAVAVQLDIAA